MRSILTFLFAAICSVTVFAQQQNDRPVANDISANAIAEAPTNTVATVLGGIVYAPRLHYYGRTDNLKSSAFLPTVNVFFDSAHLYAAGTAVLINNKQQDLQYAGSIAELGFRFGKFEGLSGNIYGNKFFYNSTVALPQSALEEQAGINLSQHTEFINFSAAASAAFSKERTDFFASPGINKIFKWKLKKGLLLLTPTYTLNMGSQNFTTVTTKRDILGPITGSDQQVFEQNRDFKILDHELSLPLIYATKHLILMATPSYVRPENIIQVSGHPELSEKAENLFYVNLSLLYTFKISGK